MASKPGMPGFSLRSRIKFSPTPSSPEKAAFAAFQNVRRWLPLLALVIVASVTVSGLLLYEETSQHIQQHVQKHIGGMFSSLLSQSAKPIGLQGLGLSQQQQQHQQQQQQVQEQDQQQRQDGDVVGSSGSSEFGSAGPAAGTVTDSSAGAGNPTAPLSASSMFQPPGYLPWSMPTHNVKGSAAHYSYFKHDNDSVPHRYPSMSPADQMCEEFWGSGFDYLHNLLGNPPPGPFDSRHAAGGGDQGAASIASGSSSSVSGSGSTSGSGSGSTSGSGNSNSSSSSDSGGGGSGKGRRLGLKSEDDAVTGRNGASWGPEGWFRCFHSRALHSAICEGSMVAVYPSRMKMAQGNEEVRDVMGRGEQEEYPRCEDGAIEVAALAPSAGSEEKMQRREGEGWGFKEETARGIFKDIAAEVDVMMTLRSVPSIECAMVIDQPVVLQTRHEYVNMYHLMTSWWSAYQAVRVTGLRQHPLVVLLDAHAKGHLDPAWSAMYSGHRFIKSFEPQVGAGAVCFRHAVFAPYGYHSPIDSAFTNHRPHEGEWRELAGQRGYTEMTPRRCSGFPAATSGSTGVTARATEFAEFVVKSHGVERSTADWAPQLWRDDGEREGEAQLARAASTAPEADPQTLNTNPGAPSDSAVKQEQEEGVGEVQAMGGGTQEGAWKDHVRTRHKGEGRLRREGAGRRLVEGEGRGFSGNTSTGILDDIANRSSSNGRSSGSSSCSSSSSGSSSSSSSSGLRRILSEADANWSRLKHGTHALRVLFLRRDAKLVHPRQQDPSFMEMRITNQEGVIEGMQLWAVQRGGGLQVLGTSELRGNGRGGGGRRRLKEGDKRSGRNDTAVVLSSGRGRVIGGRSSVCEEIGCRGKWLVSALDERERELLHSTGSVMGMGKRRRLVEGSQGKRLVYFINGTVAAWTFEEQLAAMQWADIIVGPHGAGLTHVLYLRPHSALIEMRGVGDERDHYELLAHVRGLQYVRIPSSGSVDENVQGIVQAINHLTTP